MLYVDQFSAGMPVLSLYEAGEGGAEKVRRGGGGKEGGGETRIHVSRVTAQ